MNTAMIILAAHLAMFSPKMENRMALRIDYGVNGRVIQGLNRPGYLEANTQNTQVNMHYLNKQAKKEQSTLERWIIPVAVIAGTGAAVYSVYKARG